jgi:ribonuclease R
MATDDGSYQRRPIDASNDFGLPTETSIVDYVNRTTAPPDIRSLVKAFNISQANRRGFRKLLRNMAERGLISGNRLAPVIPNTLAEISVLELIDFDDNGDGFARPVEDFEAAPKIRVLLSSKAGRAPAVGEQILARLKKLSADYYEAQIIRVLDRHKKRIFGIVAATGKGFRLKSADRGKRESLSLRLGPNDSPHDGDLVEAELLPSRATIDKTARIINNLGNSNDPGAYSALAIAEFDIPHHFSEAAQAETEGLQVPPATGRRDLRDVPLVTIDGSDARDFDDAVFAEPLSDGGWRLLVAIADVAHYVRPDSALDHEARKRGNSVYFPDRVVPMLPEPISNDLCSLRPHEDRAAMVAEIHIDNAGRIQQHQIYRALIRSHARLTYDQVQAVYDGTLDEPDCEVSHGTLHALFGAWHSLNIAREEREPLALNLMERRIIMDDVGHPTGLVQRQQSQSQRLIEDFMIAANVVAAETLIAKRLPCVFRVHDTPDPKKAATLSKLAESLGGSFTTGQVLRPHHFNKILALAAGTDNELMVNETILRSQAKAVYGIDNIGHFGLSLRHYAHFTSPIRRYADLLVHRALVDALPPGKKRPQDGLNNLSLIDIAEICTHISETESTAVAAERRTIDRYAALLFQPRLGNVVSGSVSSVIGFGLFVRLDNGAADGLLPISTLPNDFYDFDEEKQSLDGRYNGWSFHVGAQLEVKITEVTPVSGSILLDWVSGGKQKLRPSGRSKRASARHQRRPSSKKAKSKAVKGKHNKR